MITKIYIDNFRCLSNFKIAPQQLQLWLGDNGSGKSSVLDALQGLQRVLSGGMVADFFHASSLTAWDKRRKQHFSVALEDQGERFEYELVIEYPSLATPAMIAREELRWREQTVYSFDGREAHLYRIDPQSQRVEEWTSFPQLPMRSGLTFLGERDDTWPIAKFRSIVAKWLFIQPVPTTMKQFAERESRSLDRLGDNFAQWYRHLLQESPKVVHRAWNQIGSVLPGFEELSMQESGEARRLKAAFAVGANSYAFDFSDLSDGQRQLIVLYTLLEALRAGIFSTMFLDEPDNNVSLREIQPWAYLLQEVCDDTDCQALVISHHPELVNLLVRGDELWFSRPKGEQVQTRQYPITPGLTAAETMARGWDDE